MILGVYETYITYVYILSVTGVQKYVRLVQGVTMYICWS